MKEKLLNNFGLKLLSVFLAFFVWLVVVNVSNPEVTRTKEVVVEVRNEDVLTSAQKTYEIVGKDTVTISYRVRTRDASLISSSDFTAYVDLAELYDVTGSVPVKIEMSANRDLLIDSPTAKPGVIRIATEDLQRKKFDLTFNTTGELAEGYALGTPAITPQYLYLKGPVSLVRQISGVGIEVDVDRVSSDLIGTAAPVLYDANGNKLSLGEKIKFDTTEIGYQVPILKVKNLNLDFEVSGYVADGYRFTGVETGSKTIPVVGLKSALASISTITIPAEALDLTGATGDKVVEVDVSKFLPENVSIAGESSAKVTVTLKVEPLKTKVFTLLSKDIPLEGKRDNFNYTFDNEKVEVTVKGLAEDLDSLTIDKLQATMDVTDLGAGTVKGALMFNAGDGFTVTAYTEFQLTITSDEESQGVISSSAEGETKATQTDGQETESDIAEDKNTAAENSQTVS